MRRRLVITGVSLVATGLCGCTLIGFGIGKAVDHGKSPSPKPLIQKDLMTLGVGEPLEVQLWDGTKVSGRFRGLQWTPVGQYEPAYEAARSGPAPGLPRLGPGATLVRTNGQSSKGEYRGIGPGFVAFGTAGGRVSAADFDVVMALTDASGRRIGGRELRTLVAERRVPLVTGISVEQPSGNRIVDSGQVASVSLLRRPGGAWKTGLIVGAVVDVVVVVTAAIAMSQPWDSGSTNTTTTSCPLFDSYDGREWTLDAEPLGGAFYRAAQRTDLARLDHVAEVEGEFRLRLRNEQQEIDHVDAVALRVIDHEPGTAVVPDALGRVHVVRDARPPASGRTLPSAGPDRRDAAVASLVASSDGNVWVSDPWGRDPSTPGDLRDGVELEYACPAGDDAVLVVRAGGTAFGGRVLRDVLALHGRDLQAFYARLDRDAAAGSALEAVKEREVLPTVRVFDGRRWRTAGCLRDLPSLVLRDQAVPLGPLAGAGLRVRIDGGAGLWSLDRAVVALDDGGRFEDTRVALAAATREDGVDVTELLSAADGRRHSLRPRMDSVVLRFPAPPRRPGRLRSVLVEATGYYNVMVPADGEPQREAFRRLLEEPGAVARFALERMRPRPREGAGS
ncbi:MAG TPA: hypothetical protein VGB87_16880 [Vicinamibacteria bacterium]